MKTREVLTSLYTQVLSSTQMQWLERFDFYPKVVILKCGIVGLLGTWPKCDVLVWDIGHNQTNGVSNSSYREFQLVHTVQLALQWSWAMAANSILLVISLETQSWGNLVSSWRNSLWSLRLYSVLMQSLTDLCCVCLDFFVSQWCCCWRWASWFYSHRRQ